MRGVGADAGRMSSPEQVHHNEHGERHRGHNGVAQAAPRPLCPGYPRKEGAARGAAQVPSWSLCLSLCSL
jgi:hypothetical protein